MKRTRGEAEGPPSASGQRFLGLSPPFSEVTCLSSSVLKFGAAATRRVSCGPPTSWNSPSPDPQKRRVASKYFFSPAPFSLATFLLSFTSILYFTTPSSPAPSITSDSACPDAPPLCSPTHHHLEGPRRVREVHSIPSSARLLRFWPPTFSTPTGPFFTRHLLVHTHDGLFR